jgi:hypothetical protein
MIVYGHFVHDVVRNPLTALDVIGYETGITLFRVLRNGSFCVVVLCGRHTDKQVDRSTIHR